MTAGISEITKARSGARIAVVERNWAEARQELERLAELSPDARQVHRTNGSLLIRFDGGGSIRPLSASANHRGWTFDEVVVHPDAWSDELEELYRPSLATTGGKVRVAQPTPDVDATAVATD